MNMELQQILEAIQQQSNALSTLNERINQLETLALHHEADAIYKDALESVVDDTSSLQKTTKGRRTTIENLSAPKEKQEPITITHVVNIPAFDVKILELKPRSVINFLSRVESYETSYLQKANMSTSFSREVQQELIALSDNEFNNTNIGTISIKKFIEITKKFFKPKTQSRFLKLMKDNIYFPYSNVKAVDTNSIGEFRNCVKKYSSDFSMLVELLSCNADHIPPLTNNKETGLIYLFNDNIPFGFGHGVFMQIGFRHGVKEHFKTIDEYIRVFNGKLDEWYELGVNLQPMFDAIKYPDRLPKPKVSKFQQKQSSQIKPNVAVNKIDEDLSSTFSKASSITTSDNATVAELQAVHPEMKPMDKSKRPCYEKALERVCNRPDCKFSHDEAMVQKYRDQLIVKLTNKNT